MKYAMDFSLVGRSVSGIRWDGPTRKEERFSLTTLNERLGFISQIGSGDAIFLVSGGLSSEVAKQASRQGATVYLVAGSKFRKIAKTDSDNSEESEGEEEEGSKRVSGRAVAVRLKQLSEDDIGIFNVWLPEEADILNINLSLHDWLEAMEARKAAANTMRTDFHHSVLRNPKQYKDLTLASVSSPSKALLEKAEAGKLKDVDILKALADEHISNNPHYQWLVEREERLEASLKRAVLALPLYQAVFASIGGCGPLIAARLIAYTRRIDRFPKWSHYASYAKFGLKDGKKQRRVKGESLNSHPQLNSAIQHLLIKGQLIKYRRGEMGELLQQRIKMEVAKKDAADSATTGTPTGRAIWWMGKKLCRIIYYRWKVFERSGTAI